MKFQAKKTDPGCYGDVALEIDLPPLTGTESQIAWATDLRLTAIREHVRAHVASPAAVARLTAASAGKITAQVQALVNVATNVADWIDARDGTGRGCSLREVAAKHADALRKATA